MNNIGKATIAIAVVATAIIFIGMCIFIAGFAIVEPTYMAICRNKMTSKIQKGKVYFEGRHYIQVGNEFITFPMAWQLIEFTDDDSIGETPYVCKVDVPLAATTNNRLEMKVEVSLYFSIPPQQLINFYTEYGVNYQDSIANECKKNLKNTIGTFSNEQVITDRLGITEAMNEALNRSFANRRLQFEKVLLRGISFDQSMESSIETTVLADQESVARGYNNEINKIKAEIESAKKKYAYNITVITSEAQKNATVLIEQAKATANSIYATSTAEAWSSYQAITELDADDLLRVQWARSLAATTSKDSIAIGYDTVGAKFVQKVNNA